MRTRNPDARYRAVQAATAIPEHPFEAALWNLTHAGDTHAAVAWAHEIYSKRAEREVLQAWLIARATDAEVNKWLRISLEAVAAYRHLFFDVTIFRDELDILSWIEEYEVEARGTEKGVKLLQEAILHGVDKLAHLYGRGAHVMDPQRVQEVIMTDAFHRGRAHLGAPVTSKAAQASHGFAGTALKTAQALGKRGAPDVNQLLLKLRYRDLTEPVETAVQHEEILH